MLTRTTLGLGLALGAAALASAWISPPASGAPDPVVARGRALYLANNCYLCHGTVGQGGAGPTIAPPRLPALAAFTAFVRRPVPGNMPAYTLLVLSDADLETIHAYLASLPTPAPALPALLASPSPKS